MKPQYTQINLHHLELQVVYCYHYLQFEVFLIVKNYILFKIYANANDIFKLPIFKTHHFISLGNQIDV